jgi:hypothetical protein
MPGFFAINLKDVVLSLPQQAFDVKIQTVKIGFSFSKLLLSRGRFEESINTIIFISPRLRLSLLSKQRDTLEVDTTADRELALPDDFPIRFVMVKKGVVEVIQPDSTVFLLGEKLTGRIWRTTKGIELELDGCMASRKENLALSGTISNTDERHRLSVHLSKAKITKPFRWSDISITGGVLDGVCEFLFPDTATMQNLESRGWIRVREATGRLENTGISVDSLAVKLSLEGSRWVADTVRGYYNGIAVNGSGIWSTAFNDSSTLILSAAAFELDSLIPFAGQPFRSVMAGKGWARISAIHRTGETFSTAHCTAGGFTAVGIPVSELSAFFHISDSIYGIDSLFLRLPGTWARLSGDVVLTSKYPIYSLRCRAAIDSIPWVFPVNGRIEIDGTVRGGAKYPSIDFVIKARNIRGADIELGNPSIVVQNSGHHLFFSSGASNRSYLTIRGSVDSLFTSKNPLFHCNAQIGERSLISAAEKTQRLSSLAHSCDSLHGEVRIEGRLPDISGQATLYVQSKNVTGGLVCNSHYSSEENRWAWRVRQDTLMVNGAAVQCEAGGAVVDNAIVQIDSLRLLQSITGSGRVRIDSLPFVDVSLRYNNVLLSTLNAVLAGDNIPVETGLLSGSSRITGPMEMLGTRTQLHVRNASFGGVHPLETDCIIESKKNRIHIRPMVIRHNRTVVMSVDSVSIDSGLTFSGQFEDIALAPLLSRYISTEFLPEGIVKGYFHSTRGDSAVTFLMHADVITVDQWVMDSVKVYGMVSANGIAIDTLEAADGERSDISARGFVPWSFFTGQQTETEILDMEVEIRGDLLATIQENVDGPIGGTGRGRAKIALRSSGGEILYSSISAYVPRGTLRLEPFVLSPVTGFSFSMETDDSLRVRTQMEGVIKRRPMRAYSIHDIPGEYEPFMLGPANFGILLVETPKGGVELHVPGFQEIGEIVDVEFGSKEPFDAFALSGPLDELLITGKWIVRNTDFTYPFLNTNEIPWEFDPFPYVQWDFDIVVGNRKVMYFWDIAGKRRKILRFVEGYLDPTSKITVLGRDIDKTFRLEGTLRSYKGNVYFGKVFDRNFDVVLDFVPQKEGEWYNNMPIIRGSVEALSDTSRFDRIKMTLKVTDPITGAIAEKGRLALVPRKSEGQTGRLAFSQLDSVLNITFHFSSDLEMVAGESQREFFRETGVQFTSFEGAGEFVSNFGEKYFHHYFLQRLERQLARRLGLDVINIETAIASNYFNKLYNRQFDLIADQWETLALANVGITIGRYFFRDYLFLKARSEFIEVDKLIRPEYSIGLEFQPARYFMMDLNYGVHRGLTSLEHNPSVQMQLRLPIDNMRKFLNF